MDDTTKAWQEECRRRVARWATEGVPTQAEILEAIRQQAREESAQEWARVRSPEYLAAEAERVAREDERRQEWERRQEEWAERQREKWAARQAELARQQQLKAQAEAERKAAEEAARAAKAAAEMAAWEAGRPERERVAREREARQRKREAALAAEREARRAARQKIREQQQAAARERVIEQERLKTVWPLAVRSLARGEIRQTVLGAEHRAQKKTAGQAVQYCRRLVEEAAPYVPFSEMLACPLDPNHLPRGVRWWRS